MLKRKAIMLKRKCGPGRLKVLNNDLPGEHESA
jgi:hypothetical protein